RGLDAGADDYLTKPFSLAELMARLRAVARREAVERPAELRAGDLCLDPASARSWYERAAAAGSVEACRELGRMCEEGIGGAVDEDRARALYEQAAELGGDVYARRRLVERFGLSWYGGPDLT
ncbi:MAG TPA: hypothetical protein PKA64_12310, partial [Myxococcota bacterium]|nr:hypothetical protein [Myxococcota bacterium]